MDKQTTTSIDVGNLIGGVERFRNEGYRLVQIGCTKVGDLYEINYSFDKDYHFENIRITISGDTESPEYLRDVLERIHLRERDARPVRHPGPGHEY